MLAQVTPSGRKFDTKINSQKNSKASEHNLSKSRNARYKSIKTLENDLSYDELDIYKQQGSQCVIQRFRDLGIETCQVTSQMQMMAEDDCPDLELIYQELNVNKNVSNHQSSVYCFPQNEKVWKYLFKGKLEKIKHKLTDLYEEKKNIISTIEEFRFLIANIVADMSEYAFKIIKNQLQMISHKKQTVKQVFVTKNGFQQQKLENIKQKQQKNQQAWQSLLEKIKNAQQQTKMMCRENQLLRDKLQDSKIANLKAQTLEQQVKYISHALQQSKQQIYELQHRLKKLSNENLQKQQQIKMIYEDMLKEQRQKLQMELNRQLETHKDQIQNSIVKHFEQQYQKLVQIMTKQHQKQVSQLKRQISELQIQKISLLSANSDYQAKFQQKQTFDQRQYKNNYQKDMLYINSGFWSHGSKQLVKCHNVQKSISSKQTYSSQSRIKNDLQRSRKDQIIDKILTRIRLRHGSSVASQINDSIVSSGVMKPRISQNDLLEKQKDIRMKSISAKLQQLRLDIRKEIGVIKA